MALTDEEEYLLRNIEKSLDRIVGMPGEAHLLMDASDVQRLVEMIRTSNNANATSEDDQIVQNVFPEVEAKLGSIVLERAEAVQALRRVCESHGDNDWSDNLNLSDIIEKHLGRRLDAERSSR